MEIKNGMLISISDEDIVNGTLIIPSEVHTVADKVFYNNQKVKKVIANNVTTFGSYCFYSCDSLTTFSAPVATTFGSYCFSWCRALTTFSAPVATTFGSDCFSWCNSLTKLFINCIEHNVKCIDSYLYVIKSTRNKCDYTIYNGGNLKRMINGIVGLNASYVACKGGFTAHGKTIKEAITDCNYKIIAETLKHTPIERGTIIDAMYYHTVTGACNAGIADFKQAHNLKDSYIAEELLPILQAKNAYAIDKFTKLINWI